MTDKIKFIFFDCEISKAMFDCLSYVFVDLKLQSVAPMLSEFVANALKGSKVKYFVYVP